MNRYPQMPRVLVKQVFGRTLLFDGHTIDSDAAPIDPTTLYNVDGGKVIPTDPERRGKRKQTKPKAKR